MFDAVIFDLDGTLTDPAIGIVGSFRHALASVGHPVDPAVDLSWMIGPPIRDNFTRFGLPDDLHDDAVAAYMDRHVATGLYEATLHDGIPELLAALRGAGRGLAVATLKPTDQAQITLDHFGLGTAVDAVFGREPEMFVADKNDLVAAAVDRLGQRGSPERAVIVGDRIHDVHGGRAIGIGTIGVTWGYAQPGEFDAPDTPDHLVTTVAELTELLLPTT